MSQELAAQEIAVSTRRANRIGKPAQAGRTKSVLRLGRSSPGSLGIGTIFLPCEVLREYFYRLPRTADRVDHPTLYEVLRIPGSASFRTARGFQAARSGAKNDRCAAR